MNINVYDQPPHRIAGIEYERLTPALRAKFAHFALALGNFLLAAGTMNKFIEVIKVSPIESSDGRLAHAEGRYGIIVTVAMKLPLGKDASGKESFKEIFPSCSTSQRNNPEVYIPRDEELAGRQVEQAAWAILAATESIARREKSAWDDLWNASHDIRTSIRL